jgi:2-methylisocitrate lyase-like PEP mutase family enzyme
MQKPCKANMVPGERPRWCPPKELQQIGYKLALYPVALLTSAIAAMQATLAALRPESGKSPPSISFAELQKVVGFPEYWALETKYQVSE